MPSGNKARLSPESTALFMTRIEPRSISNWFIGISPAAFLMGLILPQVNTSLPQTIFRRVGHIAISIIATSMIQVCVPSTTKGPLRFLISGSRSKRPFISILDKSFASGTKVQYKNPDGLWGVNCSFFAAKALFSSVFMAI